MSRIGKIPVAIPPKVKVEVKDRKVFVEGPKGKLDWTLPARTKAAVESKDTAQPNLTSINCSRKVSEKEALGRRLRCQSGRRDRRTGRPLAHPPVGRSLRHITL